MWPYDSGQRRSQAMVEMIKKINFAKKQHCDATISLLHTSYIEPVEAFCMTYITSVIHFQFLVPNFCHYVNFGKNACHQAQFQVMMDFSVTVACIN